MSKQLTTKAGVALFALLALAGALAIFVFSASQPVAAQTSPDDVTRGFSVTSQVAPGGTVDVTITLNTGLLVEVTETLPDGWTYQSGSATSPREANVTVEQDGQDLSFPVLNANPVTYTVMAPETDGTYTFSGMFAETGTPNIRIGGASSVTVGSGGAAQPTPTETGDESVTVSPTSADVGEAVTVRGSGFDAGASVVIVLDDMQVASATVLSNGSFVIAFIVGDTVTAGSKELAVKASAGATEDLATAMLMVNPTLSLSPTSINNDVDNTVTAEIRGFMTGAVMFAAGDVDLGSGSGSSVELTIDAGELAAGTATITATQGDLSATADLEVVTPAITLSDPPMDNSKAFPITVTGTNFGPGSTATVTGAGATEDDVGHGRAKAAWLSPGLRFRPWPGLKRGQRPQDTRSSGRWSAPRHGRLTIWRWLLAATRPTT